VTPGLPFALTPGLPLGLTPGLPFGPHPCNPLCLGREPKARVATLTKPQLVKLNIDLDLSTGGKAKSFFQKYKDVFAWSYKDFKGVPLHIAQHWIELDTTILPSHQNQYRMNLNYVAMIK